MTKRRQSFNLDNLLTESGDSGPGPRACAQAGCELAGEFRAPKSHANVREYIWFCLEHVRAYNSSWNYYAGMSEDEIETDRHGTTFWHRPTWPLNGKRPGQGIRDVFGFFQSDADAATAAAARASTAGMDAETVDALSTMKLSPPLTADAIKRRYKELVKQHHPDANGGDKLAEERLKAINQAYATLIQSVGP
ncbi:MAG: J domain-containing protein [Proteobacteria bacterium]|nr:J domain-containing protein [Pseudomonadota bacterium]